MTNHQTHGEVIPAVAFQTYENSLKKSNTISVMLQNRNIPWTNNCTISSKDPHLPYYLLYLPCRLFLVFESLDSSTPWYVTLQHGARRLCLLTVLCAPSRVKGSRHASVLQTNRFCETARAEMQLWWPIHSFLVKGTSVSAVY